MLALNSIIDKIVKKQDISCNNLNLFFLQCLGYTSDVKIYKDCVIDNEFVFEDENELIEELYFKAKKIKNKFVSFIKIWRWKKAIKSSVDTDLYLNKLDSFKNKYKIDILENNTAYTFRLSDLVNYWIESLKNSQGLFSKPILLKNPHTNLDISQHNLYNIYFKLLNTGFIIPTLISNFFYSNMSIKTFSYEYYHILKNNTIEMFLDSNLIYEQWEQILNMLHDFRKDIDYITFTNSIVYRTKIIIWSKIKHIVKEYLFYKHSCNPLVSRDSKIIAKDLLIKYLEDHPEFGYERGQEIMRYVPYSERRRRTRTNPPPPPPIFIATGPTGPPPSVNPPPLPVINETPSVPTPPTPILTDITNPFLPGRELPRTPNLNTIQRRGHAMSSSMSLFRR
tara:strand:+ start:2195 stop:3376 length:1182 start_codon:yes stop_codon:yes gene_type:complete